MGWGGAGSGGLALSTKSSLNPSCVELELGLGFGKFSYFVSFCVLCLKIILANPISYIEKNQQIKHKQAGAELCQAQPKLCLGLFCFRMNDNSSS